MNLETQTFGKEHYIPDNTEKTREVVGLFKNMEDLQEAIRDLEGTAFPRQDISVIGNRGDLEKVFGTSTVDPEMVMDNADTPRQAPVRPEEKTIGTAAMIGGSAYVGAMVAALSSGVVTLPALIGAAAIGGLGGGGVGAFLTKIMDEQYNRHIKEQIDKGGLLLWVRTPDKEKEDLARQVMVTRGGYDVHTHAAF